MKMLFSLLICLSFASPLRALDIGATAPDFSLLSCDGKTVKLSDYKGRIVVLEWFNLGCPFVVKHYKGGDMQALQKEYTQRDVIWLTINSTHPNHQNFLTPTQAAAQCREQNISSTAMLADPDGKVGKSYGAKSTPHMFIIGADGKLAYQGAIDDTAFPMGDPKKADNYVKKALNELLLGKPVSNPQTKQYGCSIKYAD